MTTSFLSSAQVSGIRAATEGVFWDEGVILRRTASSSEANGGYQQFAEQYGNWDSAHPEMEVSTVCKISFDMPAEGRGAAIQVQSSDWDERRVQTGSILLPIAVRGSVSRLDRFRLTKKFGSTIDAMVFGVVGDPVETALGLRARIEQLGS